MELEEIQSLWSELSDQLEQKKQLSKEQIMEMTQQQYRKKINQIAYPEILGTVVCFGMVIIIFANLNRLDDALSLISAFISVLLLIGLPIASLSSIRKLQKIDLTQSTYQQTLLVYTKAKRQLCRVQKSGLYLSFFLMFTILPVFTKIMGKELTLKPLLISLPFGILFLIVFITVVVKYYTKTIRETEHLIKDLED